MKTKIFYFTGTGNTLKLAKDLAAELGDTELVRIRYDMEYDQTDCDAAGIAYPVYCFVQPNIVTNFINNVKFRENIYIFGLASYGGLLAGSGIKLKKLLAKRGYVLNAGFAVNMPGNATTVYDVLPEEKRNAMYAKESTRIKEIASMVRNRETREIETNKGLLGRLMTAVGPMMMKGINKSAKAFTVDETCDSCGICENVCPVNNIVITDGEPVWSDKCECCLACFHWCPKAAIQAGKKTASRGRYHHPEASLPDMYTR
ncbi:MAG: EFR1 family ferrodoxin [Elusimicrobia bacterium]|nr:EFR1 family ferrodoxin [Elusimicrobiota bacterium]